ncbi:tyrosine-type recombinase/integrase [Polycladomyces subterraneus]|uniref:Tyrosine-type recombinase/integrase n=1 Tax=Polycladomyces subterraneus TaxID=1016997 RepID=A0ABT8IM20_9BACL|nr:tyrosine-type recombinase/integrase [Polycladomyces subterraneus]MDN4593827.1 tyrosine-type recombinase/integrase [Polycladomyces subterraneus]
MNYLDRFESWLKEEGKRTLTIDEYLRSVRFFEKWYTESVSNDFEPAQITALDIQDWRQHMQIHDKLQPATINKRISALKVYWSFLVDQGLAKVDVARKVKVKRVSKLNEAPRWLDRKEVAKVQHAIESENNEWKRARNLAIFMFMLKAGLRISEVRDLDVAAVDERYWRVTITAGKGGKWRMVPMNHDLIKSYQEWKEHRGDLETDRLFVNRHGKPMSRQAIHQQLERYFKVLDDKEVSAHCLRHTFCKSLIDQGVDIQNVAALAGHESIETTRRYTTPSEKELRKAVELISEER